MPRLLFVPRVARSLATALPALVCLVWLAAPALASGSPPQVVESPICTAARSQFEPAVSGNIVVWQDGRIPGPTHIYGYDLATKTEFPICTAPGGQGSPHISGNIVVWDDLRNGDLDIYGYDLLTKKEFSICTAPGSQFESAISGNTVVWEDHRNEGANYNYDIYGFNLVSRTEFPICTAAVRQIEPAISGDIVVWSDFRSGDFELYQWRLSNRSESRIPIASGGQLNPAISGDIVVWDDFRTGGFSSHIYGFDLARGREFPIRALPDDNWQYLPSISGNTVVWYDDRNGGCDIYGYDLATKTEFPICLSTGLACDPAVSGNVVVWEDTRNGSSNSDIYAATLTPDTVGPVCKAQNATVRRGARCKLRFDADDNVSKRVSITLSVETSQGRTLKSWSWNNLKVLPVGDWYCQKYTCRLSRGTYRIRVSAIDLAGNQQSKLGKAYLRVK